jgi:hypothetical protein
MDKATRFEELWIWQQARELVTLVHGDFRSGAAAKDYEFAIRFDARVCQS